MTTYKHAYKEITDLLLEANIENAELDAWYLFSSVAKMSRTDLFLRGEDIIEDEKTDCLKKMAARRIQHEPLQYILGEQEFMGLNFKVNESVLIPRQDTEILVEMALKVSEGKKVLDVCTGSGCIIISLSKLSHIEKASAVDISEAALSVAKENAAMNDVCIEFLHSNMFENIKETYDIIVSNPPYIRSEEVDRLMPEVRLHEPRLALDGTEDGLKFYRILAKEAKEYLNPGGFVFFEIGCDQADEVCALLKENGYDNIKVTKDYAKLDRVVSANYAGNNGNR